MVSVAEDEDGTTMEGVDRSKVRVLERVLVCMWGKEQKIYSPFRRTA